MQLAENRISLAVQPLPVEWIDSDPLLGGALLLIDVDGSSLRDRAVAAGASASLQSPRIENERYFEYLGGAVPEPKWTPWGRGEELVLLATGRELAGETTYCARIRVAPEEVVWDHLAECSPQAPQDLPSGVSATSAELAPLRFERVQYDEAVRDARALFDEVALDLERVTSDSRRRQLNDLVRRLRVVEALLLASSRRDDIADIAAAVRRSETRWPSIHKVTRVFGVSLEPAVAILEALQSNGTLVADVSGLREERSSLLADITTRLSGVQVGSSARLRIATFETRGL